MKRNTKQQHSHIVNTALHKIYMNIESDLSLEELSQNLGISLFHFHRIFKAETGRNIHETIRAIRLQKSATLLLTNPMATVSEIAAMCGYGSHTSFIKAFKDRFSMTPSTWRNGGYLDYSRAILPPQTQELLSPNRFASIRPMILRSEGFHAVYLRHRGYDESIKMIWERLHAWAIQEGISTQARQIGLYHDNPAVTPLSECWYVAAIEVPKDHKIQMGMNSFFIPPSLSARFEAQGSYDEVLALIHAIYHYWLPASGYEALTLPSYAVYHSNPFLNEDGTFSMEFTIPIRVV